VCKKLIKNSQPFGKNFQKTVGGIFYTHTVYTYSPEDQGDHPQSVLLSFAQ